MTSGGNAIIREAVAHVLIIDDDPSVILTLSRMLEFEGHQVATVESAQAAYVAVDARPPDAILLDMRMPQIGGLEFLRTLRSQPDRRTIPVGVVTGDYFLTDAVLQELAALGATIRYKPLWMEDLQALMRAMLGPASQPAARS